MRHSEKKTSRQTVLFSFTQGWGLLRVGWNRLEWGAILIVLVDRISSTPCVVVSASNLHYTVPAYVNTEWPSCISWLGKKTRPINISLSHRRAALALRDASTLSRREFKKQNEDGFTRDIAITWPKTVCFLPGGSPPGGAEPGRAGPGNPTDYYTVNGAPSFAAHIQPTRQHSQDLKPSKIRNYSFVLGSRFDWCSSICWSRCFFGDVCSSMQRVGSESSPCRHAARRAIHCLKQFNTTCNNISIDHTHCIAQSLIV